MDLFRDLFVALWVSLAESAPWVMLGIVVAGILYEFVPQSLVQQRFGGLGFKSVIGSVCLGALVPVCSCSTIPLGLGMARRGVANGTTLAFMTSAPAISPISVVLGVTLLGPQLLGAYALMVLVGALILGWVGNQLLGYPATRFTTSSMAQACRCGCVETRREHSTFGRLQAALRWGVGELGTELSLSLLVGLTLATLCLLLIPDAWVIGVFGRSGLIGMIAVIAVALPAYTCSIPALLLANSLIVKGADPGVAVAFLIAGPATNLAELNAIRSGIGARAAAYYLVAIIVLALGAGTLLSSLLHDSGWHVPPSTVVAHEAHSHLHFGERELESVEYRGSLSSISSWRHPFVFAVCMLACNSLATRYSRRKKSQQLKQDLCKPGKTDFALVALEGTVSEGVRS